MNIFGCGQICPVLPQAAMIKPDILILIGEATREVHSATEMFSENLFT